MIQWITIFKKEMVEYWRNLKWVWVPLVFILLAIMDPLSTYYLPQILDAVGGLPDGAVFEIPEVPPADALMMSLSQFSLIGTAIIVLMSMGLISAERKSGIAELVLVKPVGYFTYITSKWAATLLVVLVSYSGGMLASWYYVNLLFGELAFIDLWWTVFFYSLWLTFVVALNTFYNTLFKSPGIVAFASIATIVIMKVINSIFSHILTWFPNSISAYLREMLHEGSIPGHLWGAAFITTLLIALLLAGSLFTLKRKEMAG